MRDAAAAAPAARDASTDRTFVVERSVRRLLLLFLFGILITALSAAIVIGIVPAGIAGAVIGAFGTLFFGAATVLTLWRLLTLLRAMLILDPGGLLDLRISKDVIPWHAIQGGHVVDMMGQSFVVLSVAPEVEKRLRVSPVQRLSRAGNARIGIDDLTIAVQDLRIEASELWRMIVAYREAHGPRG